MGQHLALKFLKRRVLYDIQVREDEERAVHANEPGGNAGRAGTHSFPKDACCFLWRQFDGMNLFGAPATGKGGLSSRRTEVAHPVHYSIRGNEVVCPFLIKNRDWGLDRLAAFPSANCEQCKTPYVYAQAQQRYDHCVVDAHEGIDAILLCHTVHSPF